MFYILTILFTLYFVLTLASIVAVLQEDVLYSKKEKTSKIVFILFVPVFASIIELVKLNKKIKRNKDRYKEDINQNARVYEFFDKHTPDLPMNTSDSNPL